MIPILSAADVEAIPGLDVAQMIEVDRAMVEDLGIVLVQMMDLADIGVPPDFYAHPPLAFAVPPVFAASDLVRLR
jgi:hypothetical protein